MDKTQETKTPATVGSHLKKLRKSKKLSQEAFGELLSMSQPAYSRLETGETEANFKQLPKLLTSWRCR